MKVTCDACKNSFEAPEDAAEATCPKCGASVSTLGGEFSDFFETGKDDAAPTPEPAPPKKKTNDGLLPEFGNMDDLLDAPAPAKPEASGEDPLLDDLLSDFGSTQQPAPSAPQEPAAEPSRPDAELEELFSEVSEAGVSAEKPAEEGSDADAVGSELGLEYKKRRRKIPKPVLIGVPASLVAAGLVVVVLARFIPGGVFGFAWGQKPKDGYEPPSSRVLKQLNSRYEAAAELLDSDTIESEKKAIVEFDSILKTDSRHSPTDARLAEAILLVNDNAVMSNDRKKVTTLLEQAEKFHAGSVETVRAKSRASLAFGEMAEAESLARRALTLSAKDVDTLILLGEIAWVRGDLEMANQYLTQALGVDPKHRRALHLNAVVQIQQGKVAEGEKALRELSAATPPHVASDVELYRLLYSQYGKVDEAKQGLKALVETKAAMISPRDLGRAWRYLAEIAEAAKILPEAISAMEKSVEADRTSHANGFYLGRLYLAVKDYEKASQEFGRASSLSPTTPEYLVYHGNTLRELGKIEDSLADLNKALEKSPSNVEGLYQLGLTLRVSSRPDEAVAAFENVLKNDPRHIESMINLGELYLKKDNFTIASTHLRAAIAQSPKSVRAHIGMGEILLITRKPDEALAEFRLAEAEDPKDVKALSNIGKTFLALGKMDQAAAYFEKALTLDSTRVETQVALGELLHRKKEYSKALETYRRVLEMQPKDYDTRVKLALVLIDQQSFQEAVTELQNASQWKPDYFPTRLALGVAWRGIGNLDSSLEEINRSIQIRPESADAFYELELTHIFRNDPIAAEKAMEKAVEYDPKFIAPIMALGDYYDSRNLYGEAARYFGKAEKVEPSNSDILLKMAEAYRHESKMKIAKTYYDKTIRANVKATDAYVGLGLIAEEEGASLKASQFYRKAQAADPDNPKPYKYLGFLYKDMNRKNDAILAFRKYLKLDPQSKEKKDIEDTIYAMTH